MPTVFRFRVSFEDYEDVHRDIEIKSTQNFEELHYTIQSSIAFDGKKTASFYVSNDLWQKGQEIALDEKNDADGKLLGLMKHARLADYISDPHQKFLYHSDPDSNWILHVELVKILPAADEMRNYPVCVKSVGEAPKQYLIIPTPKAAVSDEDDLESLLMSNLAATALDGEEEADEPESDSLLDETEDGVDSEEIEGMSEEGEEEESDEENEEMGFADSDEDDQQSNDY